MTFGVDSADSADTPFTAEERRLCPDGACIAVLGADGRCKLCGQTAA